MPRVAGKKLTTEEAVEYTGFSKQTIYHAAKMGKLTHYSMGRRGPFYYDQEALDDWLESIRRPAAESSPEVAS